MAGIPPPTGLVAARGGAPGHRAFTPALRWVQWPPSFRSNLLPHYDGAADPFVFLQAYEKAISAASGDDKVMAS